jgi:hypothetical protein
VKQVVLTAQTKKVRKERKNEKNTHSSDQTFTTAGRLKFTTNPAANPTIASYVQQRQRCKFYNATDSLARFEKKFF